MTTPLAYSPLKVEVTVSNPTQLTDLIEFCRMKELPYRMQDAAVFAPSLFDPVLRVPTAPFKGLCGPEWLTPKGLISVKGAYQFLVNYVKVHGLLNENGLVTMDEAMLRVFGSQSPKLIHQCDLLALAEAAVKDEV
jgi:hypothetical protein